eukprot:3877042-Alexandrium_andersonii.AAC.1
MASASSRWTHTYDWEREYTWEAEGAEGEEEEDEENATGVSAGEALLEQLLALHFEGKMTAKSFCIACWWASRAGAEGPLASFALKPSASSGSFQRKIDSQLGIKLHDPSYLDVDVPSHTKFDISRSVQPVPVQAPHEAIEAELQANPALLEELKTAAENGEWAPAYRRHPVAAQSDSVVLPLCLYVDGVPFLKKDSMVGFFVYNMVSGLRHLVCSLRKRYICKCGCK